MLCGCRSKMSPVRGFSLGFSVRVHLVFLACVSSLEVTLYDTSKQDLLGWTSYSPGLQADRLGWREASYSTALGEVLRVYTICNIDYSVVNNWVRMPFIARGEANRLYVSMRFTMRKCSRYPDPASVQLCKESFKLEYYESDSDFANSSSPSWDENTYRSVDVIATDQLFTDIDNATINDVTRSVTVTKRGVYFAFYDQGACMTLLSVRIYYVVCPDQVANLTIFNRTVTGPDLISVVQTRAVCQDHAVADQSLYALCRADGTWMDLVMDGCRCAPGYQSDSTSRTCTECPVQTFKSQAGSGPCSPCPANSRAMQNASAECQCIDGFSRLPTDGVDIACTKSLGPVRSLLVTYINQTFASLSWQPPAGKTGNTVYYSVVCFSCDSSVVYIPQQSRLNSTSVGLSGLKSGTSYDLRVYAETTSPLGQPEDRSATDFSFTTPNLSPGIPKIVNLYISRVGEDSVDLVWTVTVDSVGPAAAVVSAYEVRYLDLATNSNYSLFTVYPNATISHLSPDAVYFFQVRAKTDAGWGEFSNQVPGKTEAKTGSSPGYMPSTNVVAIVAGTAVGIIVCVVIIAVVAVLLIYRRKKQSSESNSSDCDMLKYINGAHTLGRVAVNQSNSSLPSTGTDSLHIYADPYAYEDPSHFSRDRICEIEPAAITIESILLKGGFGNICIGRLAMHGAASEAQVVMIETLNESASEDERIHFLMKAETIWRFNHPNVILLRGVVSKATPHMIITELMSNGSLDYFVKENGFRLKLDELIGMLAGIASAMAYITDNGYLVRDLSAKSILVNDDLTCKVASFDMLCLLEEEEDGVRCEQTDNIPVRWCAPEVLAHRIFSVPSDVWSFGVVMWEVMSPGEIPYSGWSDEQVAVAVVNGNRLPLPKNCPEVISQLMAGCFASQPNQRPSFTDLLRSFETPSPPTVDSRMPVASTAHLSRSDIASSYRSPSTATNRRYNCIRLDDWLHSLQLSGYVRNFDSHGYHTVNDVIHLSDIELEQLGITNHSHQRTLLRALQHLKMNAAYAGTNDFYV